MMIHPLRRLLLRTACWLLWLVLFLLAQHQPASAADAEAIFINCGWIFDKTDSAGRIWQADRYFTNGGIGGGTWFGWLLQPDGKIFQTFRNGFLRSPVWYEIPVTDTTADDDQEEYYSVTLYFTQQFDFWHWLFGRTKTSKMDVFSQGVQEFNRLAIVWDGTAPGVMRVRTQSTLTHLNHE